MTATAPGGFISTGTSLWVTDAVAGFCQIVAGAGGASQLQNCIIPPTGSANAPALLGQPAYDPTGYVYLPDYSASSKGIWRYNFDGVVFRQATGINLAAAAAKPTAIALGADGNLYVTEAVDGSILRITNPSGATQTTTIIGSTSIKAPPHGLAFVGADLWIAEKSSVTIIAHPSACTKPVPCTATATQPGIVSPSSIVFDAANNLVYVGVAAGVYRINLTTPATDFYTANAFKNGIPGLYYGVTGLGFDSLGNLLVIDDATLGQVKGAATLYQVAPGLAPDGSAPQPQPANLPAPTVVSTGTTNAGWLYTSGLTTPKGALWMGNHLWVLDHALGFCKVDPILPPPSLTACAGLTAATVPGQPAFDKVNNLLYIPDTIATGNGIQLLAFDPVLETLGLPKAVVKAASLPPVAGAGATGPTALAFGPDGQLYIAMGGTSKILRLTAPSAPTHVISVIGAMNAAGAGNLAFYKGDLYDVETASVSIMRNATLCQGACTAHSLVAPLVTPASVASDGNFIYIGDARQVWKYDLAANTLTNLADLGIAPTFVTSPFAGIGGLAIDPLGQVYAADQGPVWQISFIKPTISSLSPGQIPATFTQTVTITGTNFSPGATVTACPAITPSGVTFVSATQITVTFAVGIGPLGSCGISLITATGNSFAVNLAIVATPPALTAIAPASGFRGGSASNNVSMTLTGTRLGGATVSAGPDITATVTSSTATQIVASFAISATAALGPVNLTVTTPSGTSNALAFTINAPAPLLTSIAPAQGTAASSAPVTFVGTALFGGTLNLPAGITLTGTPVVTPTSITATLVIASTIPAGPKSITVTTPGGATNSVTFNILPVLTSIAPTPAKAGTATAVTLTGTSLNTVISINAGANITVTGVVATVNQVTATFTTLNSAPLGAQSITLTNSGGTSNAVTFTITEPTPVLAGIAPVTGARGASVPVTLTGSGLVGATLNLPTGIALSGPPAVAFGQIAATLAIADNAPLGAQSITATTPGGTSIAVTFTVFAPVPVLTSITPAVGSAASSVPVTIVGTGFIDATLNLPAGITLAGAPVVTASSISANLVISPTATGTNTSTIASIAVHTPGGTSSLLSFTIVPRALLSIAKTHIGSFTQAQAGAAYTVAVSNAIASSPTIGPVTVTETVPSGLTLVSMTGIGWTCAGNTCTRADALAGGATYSPIAVTVNVSPTALSPQVNAVSVSGGNSLTASTTDSTVIIFLPPTLAVVAPALGVIGTSVPVTVTGTNLTSSTLITPVGVTATGVIVTANLIAATLNIAPTAALGTQSIAINTPGGTSNAVTFTVLPLVPTLASIAPPSGVIGTSQPVTLTGTSLNGSTLSLSPGITATSVVVTNTQITATLVAAANAPLGPASITLTTPGGTSNALTFTLVQTDTTTQGTWKPGYGAGGQAIPNNVTNYPAYAQVAFIGQTGFTWSPSTGDVRAPQKGVTAGRIASAWYSFTSFNIDINLTDGLTHRVALYCLDWDGANTRAQRIDVLDPATGQVLATTAMSAFSAGQYLVWNLTGHVTLRVTRTAGISAVVSGLFFDGGNVLLPALAAIAPAAGVIGTTVPVTLSGTNLSGANLNLGAGITATGVAATPGQTAATLAIAATAPVGPQTISVTTPGGDSGTVTFTVLPLAPTLATIAPALGAAGTSVTVALTGTNLTGATLSPGAGINATGVVATATQITGTFTIAITAPLGPQSITVTTAGGTTNVTFTVYQLVPVLAGIAPATGVVGTTVPVTLNGTNLNGAALNLGAGITATGLVATPGQITATLAIAANAPLGRQTLSVTTPGGTSGTVTFTVLPALVQTDTTTQGTWKPIYGSGGRAIPNNVTNYPLYAQVAFTGQTAFTWSPSTTDVRAAQKGVTAGRIASAWYSFTSFNIDINLTDGLAHRVALYCLDWDGANTRAQRIDVLDPATGQVLATTAMSAFSAGQYLVWNLSGHVTLRVTRTAGLTAVVSGLFFDGGDGLLPALAAVAPATGVIGTTVPVTLTGTNLNGANLNLGAGISATGVAATPGQITATLAIAATAPVGPQTISVTTPGGDSGTVTFTVLPLAPALGATGTSVTYKAYGDSITVNVGASIPANGYAALIGTAKGAAITNLAVSGSQITTQIDNIYATAVADNAQSFILTGFNDMRNYGVSAAGQQTYTDTARAALAWLSIPESAKIRGRAAGVAYTGTWANTPVYGMGKEATVAGTATVTVTGSTIYLGYIKQAGTAGSFTVSVDGGPAATVNANAGVTDGSARAYSASVYRVAGLANVAHTVLVTWVSGTVYFDWIAGLPVTSSAPISPAVYVGNCLRMPTAGYALGGVYANGSDTAVGQFNALISSIVQELVTDGLTIKLVDASSAYNPVTDAAVDNIHPADQGHAKIANAFLLVMP